MESVESDIPSFEIEIRIRCKQSNQVGGEKHNIELVLYDGSNHHRIFQKNYLTPLKGMVDPHHFHVRLKVVCEGKVCKPKQADLFSIDSVLHISVTLEIG